MGYCGKLSGGREIWVETWGGGWKTHIFRPAFWVALKAKIEEKSKKFAAKFSKKTHFFKFAPKRWSSVLFPDEKLFSTKNTKN